MTKNAFRPAKLVARLALLGLVALSGFLPIRVSAAVVSEQWVARYDGPGNGDDCAKAVAVDSDGNVYVAGDSKGASSFYDYATAKYDPAGNLLWIARYDGPGGHNDHAEVLAVDGEGNVYVSGQSYGTGAATDYATIKYNSDGVQQWVARYDGPGKGSDIVFGMAVDAAGNVYVTGEADGGAASRRDYTTIKYDRNGNMLWVAAYNGPGSYHDSARAIAVDAAGNVYVTGYCYSDIVTKEDYVTVKYNPSGKQLWASRYVGPARSPYSSYDAAEAIAVDAAGHVYVTGYSDGGSTGYDYLTIEYDAQGVEQWAARYNGTSNSRDYARAIAVNEAGQVYVTGYSENLLTGQDFTTLKYDGSGKQLWEAVLDGGGYYNDRAHDLKLDKQGNVYVTGFCYNFRSQYDSTTVKYDPAGNELWIMAYDGPAEFQGAVQPGGTENDCDYTYAITVDEKNNVYVAGKSFGESSRYDYIAVKYSQEDTPAGKDVQVTDAAAGTTITFANVLVGGNTSVNMTQSTSLSVAGLNLVPAGTLYEMDTTAAFSGTIDIAIRYDDTALTAAQEKTLKLWHYEKATNQWFDVTAYADTVNNVIYGVSPGLSFFGVTVTP